MHPDIMEYIRDRDVRVKDNKHELNVIPFEISLVGRAVREVENNFIPKTLFAIHLMLNETLTSLFYHLQELPLEKKTSVEYAKARRILAGCFFNLETLLINVMIDQRSSQPSAHYYPTSKRSPGDRTEYHANAIAAILHTLELQLKAHGYIVALQGQKIDGTGNPPRNTGRTPNLQPISLSTLGHSEGYGD